jgi:DNA-binding PadR family transcriptional regulator
VLDVLLASREWTSFGKLLQCFDSGDGSNLLHWLVKRRLLEKREMEGGLSYRITEKGEEFVREYQGMKRLSAELWKSYGKAIGVQVCNRRRKVIRYEL